MSIRITIQEVNIEEVRNGKNKYDKAEVVHTANGQSRTQKIMSFSNPAVFNVVRNMKPGEDYDITVTKNDAGFNQWAKVERVYGESAETPVNAAKPTAARVNVSTYETPEERKIKQLYIVKQSSITNALAYLNATRPNHDYLVADVIDVAQGFVDYVYGVDDLFEQDNDIEA